MQYSRAEKIDLSHGKSRKLRHDDVVEFLDVNSAEHLIHHNKLKVARRRRLKVEL